MADISTHYDKRLYPEVDVADRESCRPDLAIVLYPGHLWISQKKFELNSDIRVAVDTPPTFLVQAEDDNVDDVNNSLVYHIGLKNAGVPAEMRLYAQGRHASHDISGDGMAPVGRNVARNDRNDFWAGR